MATVTITRGLTQTDFVSRYDPEVVATIKAVPAYAREYNPASKVWTVDNMYVDTIVAALTGAGHTVADAAAPPPQPSTFYTNGQPDEYARNKAAEILESIPEDRRGAVFRAMARLLYPDLYGKALS